MADHLPKRTRQRRLSDELLHYIAKEKLGTNAVRALGLKIPLSIEVIKKYEDPNQYNQVESKGTIQMLLDWRSKLKGEEQKDQIGALIALLVKAELNELAGDLEAGNLPYM